MSGGSDGFDIIGTVGGQATRVAYLGECCVTAESYVFDLIEDALQRRGHEPDALSVDPETLRRVLVEDVFESVLQEL